MLYWLGKLTVFCYLKLVFKLDLQGMEVFPSRGPFILASNHPSYFDPPLLGTVVKRRLCFLAKEELFRTWVGRVFFQSLGAIPLKRKTNDFRAMRRALSVLKEKPLLVFPQGWVNSPLEQINEGVGFLAKRSGAPIIAARIERSEHLPPVFKHWPSKEKITIRFGRVENITPQDTRKEIAQKVMAKIKSL